MKTKKQAVKKTKKAAKPPFTVSIGRVRDAKYGFEKTETKDYATALHLAERTLRGDGFKTGLREVIIAVHA